MDMNTANLQLEGLYLAIASINNTLVAKGILTRHEIEVALERAEQVALGDYRVEEELSPAHRDAIAFPARLLMQANASASTTDILPFSELARRVGVTKEPYNDQL
jgi:predicted component of type VI protein secretion system